MKLVRKPELVEDWRRALRSHSTLALIFTVIALLTPEAVFIFLECDTNPMHWWWFAIAIALYGIVGRFVKQHDRAHLGVFKWIVIGGLLLLFLASCGTEEENATAPPEQEVAEVVAPDRFMPLAIEHIGESEGLRLEAYQDIVGVWTICYGETLGVKPGDVHTKAECDAMLARRITEFQQGVRKALTNQTIAERYPYTRDVAYTSLAYNVGIAGVQKSTAVRRLNAGDIQGGCEAIGWWNKAGGRVIRGLVLRRQSEIKLCLQEPMA